MADMNKRGPADCDDCEGERGERGERGKRGKRGHEGHDGHDGHDGATGPTGPTGSSGSTGATGSSGPSSGGLIGRQIFTTNDIYVPTPGTTKARVMMSGGGGAGGGAQKGLDGGNSVGGGGASGANLDFLIVSPTPITGGPVVIGAGQPPNGGSGGSGFPTSVTINGTTYTAQPGGGGQSAGPLLPPGTGAGPGGVTFGGSSAVDSVSGDNGGSGVISNFGGFGGVGGNGGGGNFGIGGAGAVVDGDGLPGTGYGAGGGGASANALSPTDRLGGAGAPGVVIVEEYT